MTHLAPSAPPDLGSVPLLSVVVPVRDEADSVEPLIGEIRAALDGQVEYEVVYVDDGSVDATAERLRACARAVPNLRVLRHRTRSGQSAAIRTGALAARGRLLATLDGDGQNDPADILRLLRVVLNERGAGPLLVVGERRRRRASWGRRLSSRVANWARRGVLQDESRDTGCGLKLAEREAFLALPAFDHMHRFLPALFLRAGGRVVSVAVTDRPRRRGRSHYGVGDRLGVGLVDLLGVLWLKRRPLRPVVEDLAVAGPPSGSPWPEATGHPSAPTPAPRGAGLLVGATAVAMFAIAVSAPSKLDGSNEARMAAYVWDAVKNGAWIMPRDLTGELASKPPLYVWLASLGALALGHFNRIPLYLPSAGATALLAWIIGRAGGARFGWAAGFLGGLGYLLSHAAQKQMVMARYDALFALTVTLTALAAFRAWSTGRGWTWFWLAAAAATMTKGPLGLVLGAAGLLAAVWERRTGHPARIAGSHRAGVALFLAITGGWFALAWLDAGTGAVDKLLGRELVTHAVSGKGGERIASGLLKPSLEILVDLAPWSIFAALGFWRIWRHPAADPVERRFERFLFCAFLAGLLLFSLAAHQRARLILPLLPAAALIAGREMARLVAGWPVRRLLGAALALTCLSLIIQVVVHHGLARSGKAMETDQIRKIAESLRGTMGGEWMVTHVDSPFALQFYLNTMRPLVTPARAAELLRGPAPAVVAVTDWRALERALGGDVAAAMVVERLPAGRRSFVHVVRNRPADSPDSVRTVLPSLEVTARGLWVESITAAEIAFHALGGDAALTVVSLADRPQRIRLRWTAAGTSERRAERVLGPGAAWRWTAADPS